MDAPDPTARPPEYVTVEEFAHLARVSERAVYHWIAKGAIQAVRIERTLRIARTEAAQLLKAAQ